MTKSSYLAVKCSFASRTDSHVIHTSGRKTGWRVGASFVRENVWHEAEAVGGLQEVEADEADDREHIAVVAVDGGCHLDDDVAEVLVVSCLNT